MDARHPTRLQAPGRPDRHWGITSACTAAAVCCLVSSGCTGSSHASRSPNGKTVTVLEFAPSRPAEGEHAAPPQFIVAAPDGSKDETRPHAAQDAAAGVGPRDLVATPGPPRQLIEAIGSPTSTPEGGPVLVDAKVGDINGRAIYASAIFEFGLAGISPIGAELAAEAKLRTLDNWRYFTRTKISATLRDLIREELLRAEALQKFTPEQKMGFMGFMEKLQQDFQRQRGGSRALADRNLRETEGISIDEWRRRQEDDELVKFQLRERILGRVSVSYRDIEQRYERDKERFDQPPRAVFRLAQVNKNRPEDLEAFKALLATAHSFEDAAKSPLNINQNDKGGLETRDLGSKPRAQGDFFPNAALNEAARTVAVGETAGPIELSTTMAWLHLDSEGAKKVNLYDAQLQLEDEISSQRTRRELDRYIQSLQGRASMTDAQQMVERLARIAEARYFTTPAPAAPTQQP